MKKLTAACLTVAAVLSTAAVTTTPAFAAGCSSEGVSAPAVDDQHVISGDATWTCSAPGVRIKVRVNVETPNQLGAWVPVHRQTFYQEGGVFTETFPISTDCTGQGTKDFRISSEILNFRRKAAGDPVTIDCG